MNQKQFIFNKIVTLFLEEYKQIIWPFFDIKLFENEIQNYEQYFLKLLYKSTFRYDIFNYYKSPSKEIKLTFFKDFTFFLYSKNVLVLFPIYLKELFNKCSYLLPILKILNIQEISELLNTTIFSDFLYKTLKETQTYNIAFLLNNDNESYKFFLHMCQGFLNWKKQTTTQQKTNITISDIDHLFQKMHLTKDEEEQITNTLLQLSINKEAVNINNDEVLNPFEKGVKKANSNKTFDMASFVSGAIN